MAKHDWKNEERPVFNSSKFGIVKADPANPGSHKVVEPSLALNNAEIVPTPTGGRAQGHMPHFIDGSDAMANKGMTISFQHVPSEEDVTFKAFITAFNETYNCDWNSETVYGRTDPIHLFKNTQREITLAFNVPAASEGEAFENLGRVQRLISFLYPSYAGDLFTGDPTSSDSVNKPDVMNALTIANSPLVRLRIMNVLAARPQIGDAMGANRVQEATTYSTLGTFERHVEDGGASEWPTTSIGSNRIAGNYHGGLLGIIKNVSVNHNLDNPDHGVFEINQGTILPKMIEVNLTFSAIHEHTLGWFDGGFGDQVFANELWPYGINDAARFGDDGLDGAGPPDVSGLQEQNTIARQQVSGALDQLEEEVEQFEQDIANAEARYSGMFGKARFKKDIKKGRYKDNPYIASAVRGQTTQMQTDSVNTILRNEYGFEEDYYSDLDTYRINAGYSGDYSEFIS